MKELYKIYLECVKKEVLSYDEFLDTLQGREVIKYKENGELIGFSIIRENEIEFLGIKEDFRKKGFGTKLLDKTEDNLLEKTLDFVLRLFKVTSLFTTSIGRVLLQLTFPSLNNILTSIVVLP